MVWQTDNQLLLSSLKHHLHTVVQLGAGNTVATNGIGATICAAFEDGSVKAGISTRAFVGGGTGAASTVTLSPEKNDIDFVSFFVQYTGGTNTDLKSYKVYVTKNGGFNQGSVGV